MTPSHRTGLYMLVLAVIAIAAGGCRSTGEPIALLLRGTFVLRTVNGGPLPADISLQPDYQMTLLADTLRFDGKSLAKMGRTERLHFLTSAPEVVHVTFDFRVRIVGETIYLDYICPPGADCINRWEISGHLVDANTLMLGDSQPYIYVRP